MGLFHKEKKINKEENSSKNWEVSNITIDNSTS